MSPKTKSPARPTIAGEVRQGHEPDWEPLLALVGDHIAGWFMWMYDVALADGRILNAYKHIDTRRYIHVGADLQPFLYTESGEYEAIPVLRALELAFYRWELCPEEEGEEGPEGRVRLRVDPWLWRPRPAS